MHASSVTPRFVDALPMRTSRLTLRPLAVSDIDHVAGMLADAAVMRHVWRPLTRAEAGAWLRQHLDLYQRDGTGRFAVCLGSTWIGDCGLVQRRIDGIRTLELGYEFRREVWGQGYATEAASACLRLAFSLASPAAAEVVTALVRPGNRGSQRVVRRLGFRVAGAVVHAGLCHERWNVTPDGFAASPVQVQTA